jgi:hypothetical protein
MKFKASALIFIIPFLLLSACSDQFIDEAHLPTTPNISTEPTHTPLLKLTDTPEATNTATLEPSPTFTLEPTLTPTLFIWFKDAWLYAAWMEGENTVFSFIVPYVTESYFGTVDGFNMTCAVNLDYENNLVCITENNLFGKDLRYFEFYSDEQLTDMVHSGEYSTGLTYAQSIPTETNLIWPRADYTAADISWAGALTWCPQRGQNLSCETEYRNYSGQCLVGHTCYDACGWYYSVNTIRHGVGDYTFSEACW